MVSKTIAIALIFVAAAAVTTSYPLHASCTIDWVFKATCEKVNEAIVNQAKKWESDDNCAKGGEKCLYHITSTSAEKVEMKHETPKAHYLDDLTFTFATDDSVCKVHGHSTSETWYAILDKSTNYCNLHNLITGSGLDKYPGYNETTSNSVCTQYSSANCDAY